MRKLAFKDWNKPDWTIQALKKCFNIHRYIYYYMYSMQCTMYIQDHLENKDDRHCSIDMLVI